MWERCWSGKHDADDLRLHVLREPSEPDGAALQSAEFGHNFRRDKHAKLTENHILKEKSPSWAALLPVFGKYGG